MTADCALRDIQFVGRLGETFVADSRLESPKVIQWWHVPFHQPAPPDSCFFIL
jgi:hypothetical protein